jgi:hypothetical protein
MSQGLSKKNKFIKMKVKQDKQIGFTGLAPALGLSLRVPND